MFETNFDILAWKHGKKLEAVEKILLLTIKLALLEVKWEARALEESLESLEKRRQLVVKLIKTNTIVSRVPKWDNLVVCLHTFIVR